MKQKNIQLIVPSVCIGLITGIIAFALFRYLGSQLAFWNDSPSTYWWNEIVPYIVFIVTGAAFTYACLSEELFPIGSIVAVVVTIIGVTTGLIGPLASTMDIVAVVMGSISVCANHWFGHLLNCKHVFSGVH